MDDYRDLVTVSLTLLCAGIMLVAGQLYIERYPMQANRPVDSPRQPPALISHAAPPHENMTEPRQGVEKNRAG
jgi:hypothetical protein